MRDNGRLSIEFTVWCGCPFCDCQQWEQVGEGHTKRGAGLDAKRRGWAYTRAFGWLCKECDDDCGSSRGKMPAMKESATNSEAPADPLQQRTVGDYLRSVEERVSGETATPRRAGPHQRSALERIEAERAAGRIL